MSTTDVTTHDQDATTTVHVLADHVALGPEPAARFHHVWLRDNCGCTECRVTQSGERALFTAHIPDDIAPRSVDVGSIDGAGERAAYLDVTWKDGHRSRYSLPWLLEHDYSRPSTRPTGHEPVLWDARLGQVPAFRHAEVLGDPSVQMAYLAAVRDLGVAVVKDTPRRDGEVARFAEAIGHVRETAFERIHNVRHDPAGYNVAHTPVELKPHTDLPSYHWPPSIQLLHFVTNEASGGESTVTDGWAVVADLRREDPEAFDVLCRTPVSYQLYSAEEDTSATAPMIELDASGRVRTFRFSNQLAQPVAAPFEQMQLFYRAYRELGRRIDGERYKLAFKAESGDLLTVHGHRVMHGRLAFDPASGARHLQDVYMEYDDLVARHRVLSGTHIPRTASEVESA